MGKGLELKGRQISAKKGEKKRKRRYLGWKKIKEHG